MKLSQNIFSKKFFFFENIFLRISSPDFGKGQKFHDFVFDLLGFSRNLFQAGKDFFKISIPFYNLIFFLFQKHFLRTFSSGQIGTSSGEKIRFLNFCDSILRFTFSGEIQILLPKFKISRIGIREKSNLKAAFCPVC